MDAQLKKGVLEMCILFLVAKNNLYGYDLIRMMKEYFPEVNESTFYAILRRLCKDGATEVYCGEESNGPVRKYYKITKSGIMYLSEVIDDWEKLKQSISKIGIGEIS